MASSRRVWAACTGKRRTKPENDPPSACSSDVVRRGRYFHLFHVAVGCLVSVQASLSPTLIKLRLVSVSISVLPFLQVDEKPREL